MPDPPAEAIDTGALFPFDARVVRILLAVFCLALAELRRRHRPSHTRSRSRSRCPIALDKDFEFRKTKEYFLDPMPQPLTAQINASVSFERNYRMYGAITALDARARRFGNYFDFFWRARRDADVQVRLEYRQEKLHAFVQAREVRLSACARPPQDRVRDHRRRLLRTTDG